MNKVVELEILGDPLGKQRPRVSMANGVVRTYTPQKTTNYESLIAHEYMSKYGQRVFDINEPIKAIVVMHFGLNKGDYGKNGLNKNGREKIQNHYAPTKVDIDNCLKCVFDSLNSICYPDDKQIVCVVAHKVYTQDTPRVCIKLESLKQDENREQNELLF